MQHLRSLVVVFLSLTLLSPIAMTDEADDPYVWLEDVTGDKALNWVREQNAASTKELESDPRFEQIRSRLLAVYESQERIPYVSKQGEYFYNFWRDANNVRGVWRRTTFAEYRKKDPKWEVVLDIDALATKESENWVWGGYRCSHPDYRRCLVFLSRGGGDTYVVREFDLARKEFLADGFTLPAAKHRVTYRDPDTLYVGTDFGPGSLTDSGYPRVVKVWPRGAPLDKAVTVFEGEKPDVSVVAAVSHEHDFKRDFIIRAPTFFTNEVLLRDGDRWIKLDVPADANVDTFREHILLTLRSNWSVGGQQYIAGSALAMPWDRFLKGDRAFEVLYAPTARSSLDSITSTRNFVLISELDNVRTRLHALSYRGGKWERQRIPTPEFGSASIGAVDNVESDEFFLTIADFVTPSTLYVGKVGDPNREQLKQLPAFFNTAGLEVSQHEAISKDGTRVPYFQVAKQGLKLDGSHPTLLYGYGGFEISQTPGYSPGMGLAWLEQGGVYVLANIRGGAEFGPTWHQAALKENRQRAFDDFIAIAEHLVARKVTAPKHLGIMGGSNGGLLMGAMLTQRPDLFGAVVCQVPLLDMRRYHKLLAGASWMAEYGDPDKPEEWAYISKYSPYQNVRKDREYPRVLFTTSTRDDRVHPGHARKMMARMKEQGHDVLLYENIEGGHGGAANNKQMAYMNALAYTFLLRQLK